ncbi:MAG: hypothetical protein PVG71_02855 [Anaerolineae bacterium]|jgi:hypothetical protein
MPPVSPPVLLEVIAQMPTGFFHCAHCERIFDVAGIGESVHLEVQASYPQEVLEEAQRLAGWLEELATEYGEQLQIRVVDAQSIEGFFRSLRHWVRRYPAFIVGRRSRVIGWDRHGLKRLLEERVAEHVSSVCDQRQG